MKVNDIQSLLITSLPLEKVYVTSDSDNYFKIIAIGEVFSTLNYVQKQQLVYKPLAEYIANKTIHAVSIKTYTPKEWSKNKQRNNI
ncbi:hypothetical protein CRV11_02080 [Candidatus Pantoea edessiphila]|uniref:BolA family transcriptional regulator n=1 Tax=Candidatus Pantoea edessiphila TaxID=2044610 RepID=A0A2P5SY86_9GAMM|nr:BolA/IbaG family iron-sulfur metabolism protein [Candidatus Pantoea edessiphila]MBK4775650.1 BolA/IbaG family iron-sulfur metabolism protein [Pantoea sp. Edef]PPI87296.1 hypothetical protein CRV11_02080 [Candidatus Pantoea edessiphila]